MFYTRLLVFLQQKFQIMYEQISEQTLYLMFYAVVAAMSMIACCYLLFRRGNAFAPDITSPVRLRQWTAAFFAAIALCHLWYLPTYFLSSSSDMAQGYRIAALFDSMTVIPLTIVVLLAMLQDRKRPLWPAFVMAAPLAVGAAWCIASHSEDLLPMLFVYFLLMWLGVIIYRVCAIRQYGRWLRDNYADLEHKEIRQGFVVMAIFFLVYAIYSLDSGELIYEYATEVFNIVLICYLLWRVETLSDLSIPTLSDKSIAVDDLSLSIRNKIGSLLKQHCEEPQLYLQYDISISQLAKKIGINRSYLSKHFALQGITYNAYINGLRIQHFINLYHEAVVNHQPVTAQQLAYESGFRSYSTFSAAFKHVIGMTATEWMRLSEK